MATDGQRPLGELSIVDETAVDNGDIVLTPAEFARLNNTMMRRLAAEADTDVINGKSTRLEMQAYFVCQRSLFEFDG